MHCIALPLLSVGENVPLRYEKRQYVRNTGLRFMDGSVPVFCAAFYLEDNLHRLALVLHLIGTPDKKHIR